MLRWVAGVALELPQLVRRANTLINTSCLTEVTDPPLKCQKIRTFVTANLICLLPEGSLQLIWQGVLLWSRTYLAH